MLYRGFVSAVAVPSVVSSSSFKERIHVASGEERQEQRKARSEARNRRRQGLGGRRQTL